MDCDAFRSCIDHMPVPLPDAWARISEAEAGTEARAHHEGCADCQAWLAHEQTWQQVLASVPAPRARPSAWPGVMAAIASRPTPSTSLSWELVALSRYLVPALTTLVLALGGVGLWGQATMNPAVLARDDHQSVMSVLVAEPTTELGFLQQDADAILDQWVGVSQP